MYKWLGKSHSLRKVKNEDYTTEYIGVKKNEGKILVLDLNLYTFMYVNSQKLLALHYQFPAKYLSPHLASNTRN